MSDYRYNGYFAEDVPLIAGLLIAGQSAQQVHNLLRAVDRTSREEGLGRAWYHGVPSVGMIRHLNKRWNGTYRKPAWRGRRGPFDEGGDWVDVLGGAA